MTVEFELDEDIIDDFFESVDKAQGIVTYQAPYALYVEVDTSYDRGLKPPYEPLFQWTLRNITGDREEAKGIAYAIQQKIYENGIEGEYYFITTKKEWEAKWKNVAENLSVENDGATVPEKLVRKVLEGILDDSQDKLRASDKVDTGNLINSGLVIMGADPDRSVEEIDITP